MRKGLLDDAAGVCSAVLEDSPDTASIYLKLAEISAKKRDYSRSLEYCTKAREAAPYTHPPKVLLAVFANSNGDGDRALTLLHEARDESPDHPMPPLILGQLACRKQQWLEAREDFAAAAALPIPDSWPESHRHRFLVLLHSQRLQLAQQLQDADLARDALTQWLKIEPDNARVRAMYDQLAAGVPK